jgi:hypothetical protein
LSSQQALVVTDNDLAARVSAALGTESIPMRRPACLVSWTIGLAAAAGVAALAVLVTLGVSNQATTPSAVPAVAKLNATTPSSDTPPQLAVRAVAASSSATSSETDGGALTRMTLNDTRPEVEERLNSYLLDHSEYLANRMRGMLPHAWRGMTRVTNLFIARLLACTLAIFVGVAAAAEDSDDEMRAQQLLERVSEAALRLNYDGTFVYRNGDWMESMRIIHRAGTPGGRGSQARLMSLSGAAREVIRDETRATCILPDSESVRVSKSTPRADSGFSVFDPSGDFRQHYSLSTAAGERVAGRVTQRVSVMPKDMYRYGYRLSVDDETGVL